MKEIINWYPEKDNYLKEKEIKIHDKLHDNFFINKNFSSKDKRIEIIKKGENKINEKIKGNVLEIGSGNGYASVYLAKNRNVNKVYSMECNKSAVDKLIRENFKYNNVDENKYELVLGSFNNIYYKNYFNFVISLGVLHHSGNLFSTLKSIYESLQNGGYLIGHEPYMDDYTQNEFYIEKSEKTKNFGDLIKVKEKERDDNFFRKCEYLTAAYHNGFEVDFHHLDNKKDNLNNCLLILKKPEKTPDFIPHKWEF